MLSQITDAVWMIEVGDELHWDDCKKIGTMTEWNKAIQNFNNKHNEHHIPIFTNYNLTVEKIRIVDDSDDEEEEECIYCKEMNDGTITNPLDCDPQPKMINNKWKCPVCCDESEDEEEDKENQIVKKSIIDWFGETILKPYARICKKDGTLQQFKEKMKKIIDEF